MSVQQRKEQQGYKTKPTLPICSNCIHYRSEFSQPYKNDTPFSSDYKKEVNIFCSIGKFAVMKTATCNKYQEK